MPFLEFIETSFQPSSSDDVELSPDKPGKGANKKKQPMNLHNNTLLSCEKGFTKLCNEDPFLSEHNQENPEYASKE